MRPDDLLNAIGDVEEKYIKNAHRKYHLKAFLTSFCTVAILIGAAVALQTQDYILSRINPDFTVNTGYVELEHLQKINWTTMEHTAYRDGDAKARTVFKRTLYDNYVVTHIPETGETVILVGVSKGDWECWEEYLDKKDIRNFYMETYYSADLIGRVDSMVIGSRFAYEPAYTMLNYVKMEYLESTYLVKQVQYVEKDELEIAGWRSYSYENSKVSRTEDFDGDGCILGYTVYSYDGCTRKSENFSADGQLTSSTETEYDRFGRVLCREYYDETGDLTGREVYRYRFWELFFGLEGAVTMVVILSLAATLGVAVYEDWLPVPRRKREKSEQENP